MTVAAAHALALRECLRNGDRALASRFFAAAWQPTDDAWRLATGADLALPEVRGRRPLSVRAVNRYLRRLNAVAEHDPVAAAAFTKVVTMHERPGTCSAPRSSYGAAAALAADELDERAGRGQRLRSRRHTSATGSRIAGCRLRISSGAPSRSLNDRGRIAVAKLGLWCEGASAAGTGSRLIPTGQRRRDSPGPPRRQRPPARRRARHERVRDAGRRAGRARHGRFRPVPTLDRGSRDSRIAGPRWASSCKSSYASEHPTMEFLNLLRTGRDARVAHRRDQRST